MLRIVANTLCTCTIQDGFTPLQLAIVHGNVDVAEMLIAKDAQVDIPNKVHPPLIHVVNYSYNVLSAR